MEKPTLVESLSEIGWEGAGAIVGLLALFGIPAAVFAPALYRTRRKLAYRVVDDDFLPTSGSKLGPQKVPVGKVRRTVVELRSSGKVDIEPSHYVRPVTFSFGKDSTVLRARVESQSPENIGAAFREFNDKLPHQAVLDTVLLNSGDTIVLEFLVADSNSPSIEVDGRIVGVKEIIDKGAVERTQTRRLKTAAKWIGLPALVIASLWLLDFPQFVESLDAIQSYAWLQRIVSIAGVLTIGVIGAFGGLLVSLFVWITIHEFQAGRKARVAGLPPSMYAEELIEALKRFGYQQSETKGMFVTLADVNGNEVTFPSKGRLGEYLVKRALEEANVTAEEFRAAPEVREALCSRSWLERLRYR